MPSPGFANTAAYFATLAHRARDNDQRDRWLEVAGFYRALAQIAPAVPPGFKASNEATRFTRAQRWRARADECRALGDTFKDQSCRDQLMRLAETYDRMAISAE